MNKQNFRIIFMGTPDFATESLRMLHTKGFNIVSVITAPDKPAGRGRKLQESAVKKYAVANNIHILQPTNLKSETFIKELENLKADLQVVVAFRMLPETVWSMPKFGTVNLHASLLPQYRGAAPINHAIINGENKTGVTTFFIEKEIDTGNIIFKKEIEILPDENAEELHNKLMTIGGKLIIKTVEAIMNNTVKIISQKELLKDAEIIKPAPKIFKNDCEINWGNSTNQIYNFIRGLSPYPAAYTNIANEKHFILKIFKAERNIEKHTFKSGNIISDNKSFIRITTADGYIDIKELQLQGKKRMQVKEFLNGFDISGYQIVNKR
ncbi:MAG: methionyl-tRNA formyltransferase [Bacteroidales bacterium]|nr:methionyl-tRNA formyltransferase [Bacteroidales bacterium]